MRTIFCAEWRTEPKIAYYRGAMGLLLVYHVTDDSFFNNIRNWIRNIEQHASANVKKVLVGNKADMDEGKRDVPTSWVQAFADEYGIKFFETSAKTNMNVVEVCFSIAQDIKQRLSDSDSKSEETQHSELEDLFPEYGKVVHADMKKGYAFVNFEEQLDGTSFASEFNKCTVDWATDLDAIHDWGREIIFDTKCKSYKPPPRFIVPRYHPTDTADLNNMPNNNRGGSDGSGGSNSSGDGSGDDDGSGSSSDSSSDDGGINGVDEFTVTLTLSSDDIVFSHRNATKLFGVNPHSRSHVICVLPAVNDPEVGPTGKNFEIILEGSSRYGDVEGNVIEESEWIYKIEDKPGQEEEGRPSWREKAQRQVYVRCAEKATFGNQGGQVNMLFHVLR